VAAAKVAAVRQADVKVFFWISNQQGRNTFNAGKPPGKNLFENPLDLMLLPEGASFA
jgi:hypothetical protein